MLHDWSVERALFEGERLLDVYEVVDQPKMGPIRVFDRRAVGESADEARKWFGGNNLPVVWRYSSEGEPPQPRRERVISPERLQEADALYLFAAASQLRSEFAPPGASMEDEYWALQKRHSWCGVRILARDARGFRERLEVVALDYVPGSLGERTAEVLDALSVPGSEILEFEYCQAVVRLNNQLVFQLRRRARMSDDEYVKLYCTEGE